MTFADFGLTEANVTALVFLYILLFSLILLGMAVLFYLKGFGIYKMSRKLKIKRSWYGFLPIFGVFAFGRIADSAQRKKTGYRNGLISLYAISRITGIVSAVLALAFSVKLLFAADTAVFGGVELNPDIFKGLMPAVIMLVVSLVFTVTYWVLNSICAAKVYKLFGLNASKLKAVLGFIIPILLPCFVYSVCKNDPNEAKPSFKNDDSVFSIDE